MGAELVLSPRLPPLYGASVLPTHRVLLEPCTDSPRRRRSVVAEAHSNSEGNPERRFHGAIDNHHHHHPHHLHHQHQQFHHHHQQFFHQFHPHHHNSQHHFWQGSLDVGRQSSRLGSGFSIASESDVSEVEKQEHPHCASSFSYNGKCSPFPPKGCHITIDNVCAGGAVAGVDLPLSLRMLKRKQQEHGKSSVVSGLSEVGNSLLNAFSSVISMMKTLQSHTLHIRRQYFEQEIEGLLNQVQREMHVSLLWLFQQVFSCTPELMVLVMVLLADFTAFSMVNNMPLLPISLYTPPVSIVSSLSNNTEVDEGFRDFFNNMSFQSSPSIADKADSFHNSNGGWVGNGGRGFNRMAGDGDEDSDPFKNMVNLNKAAYSVDDNLPTEFSSPTPSMASHDISTTQIGLSLGDYSFSVEESDVSAMAAALAFEELSMGVDDMSNNETPLLVLSDEGLDVNGVHTAEVEEIATNHLVLDQQTMRSLVAPFTARIEDDNYSCYDRTDLTYQEAISNDTNNSLLLANYAQFLFLVRKDHDRAEELFRKAMLCDPFDCEATSRFASFLWLARRNFGAAEKAYQAALRAEPTNSFHVANYAHFLWKSGL